METAFRLILCFVPWIKYIDGQGYFLSSKRLPWNESNSLCRLAQPPLDVSELGNVVAKFDENAIANFSSYLPVWINKVQVPEVFQVTGFVNGDYDLSHSIYKADKLSICASVCNAEYFIVELGNKNMLGTCYCYIHKPTTANLWSENSSLLIEKIDSKTPDVGKEFMQMQTTPCLFRDKVIAWHRCSFPLTSACENGSWTYLSGKKATWLENFKYCFNQGMLPLTLASVQDNYNRPSTTSHWSSVFINMTLRSLNGDQRTQKEWKVAYITTNNKTNISNSFAIALSMDPDDHFYALCEKEESHTEKSQIYSTVIAVVYSGLMCFVLVVAVILFRKRKSLFCSGGRKDQPLNNGNGDNLDESRNSLPSFYKAKKGRPKPKDKRSRRNVLSVFYVNGVYKKSDSHFSRRPRYSNQYMDPQQEENHDTLQHKRKEGSTDNDLKSPEIKNIASNGDQGNRETIKSETNSYKSDRIVERECGDYIDLYESSSLTKDHYDTVRSIDVQSMLYANEEDKNKSVNYIETDTNLCKSQTTGNRNYDYCRVSKIGDDTISMSSDENLSDNNPRKADIYNKIPSSDTASKVKKVFRAKNKYDRTKTCTSRYNHVGKIEGKIFVVVDDEYDRCEFKSSRTYVNQPVVEDRTVDIS